MIREQWSDGTGSFLRIVGDEKERIADRILCAHPMDRVLPLDIELVNGHREYVYETSGYQDLGSRLEDKPLSKTEWISLLMQIQKTGEELEEYLLDSEHLMTDMETVFVSGDEIRVGMVYAGEHKMTLSESLSHLAEQALKYPEYDRESSEFIYRLHALATRGDVTRKVLNQFLRDEGSEEEEIRQSRRSEDGKEKEKKKRNSGTVLNKNKAVRPAVKNTYNPQKKDYLLPACILAAGVLVPSICLRLGAFRQAVSGETDIMMAVMAYLFFMGVAGIGVYRLWPSGTPVTVWSEEDEVTVCLLPQRAGADGTLHVMPVTMYPWRIGKDEGHVDSVIDCDGVAPVHARFEKENRSIFIVDEESHTGTRLNGNRLTPWEKQRVKDGDIVEIGAATYVIEMSD